MSLNEDIERLVARLERETEAEEAYFAIFQYSEIEDSYVKANALGLQRFAAELLKASLMADDVIADEEQSTIPFVSEEGYWTDGDIRIDYVEPVTEKPEEVIEPYEEPWQEKVFTFGCLAAFLSILFLIVVGVITVIRWIF